MYLRSYCNCVQQTVSPCDCCCVEQQFLSPESQNEMLNLHVHNVLRVIAKSIQSSKQFGIIVDGTPDCCCQEQESLCIHYVDEHSQVNKAFMGTV